MHEEVKHPGEGAHVWPEGPGRDRGPPRGQETPRRDKRAVGWRPLLGLLQEGTCSGTRPRGEVLPSAPPTLVGGPWSPPLPSRRNPHSSAGSATPSRGCSLPGSPCFSPEAPLLHARSSARPNHLLSCATPPPPFMLCPPCRVCGEFHGEL